MAETATGERELLSGNEAVALAASHADVKMATGYPGTPSTEILETLASFGDEGIIARWAPNEKVALEVALGSSFAGARSLVTMKHVGVNVAADPLMTGAHTGTEGGLVVVSADDPGMHSSQNEQDNRHYARFAGLPMLEPSSSQEAYDCARRAFELSEEFGTIVLLRLTTRICHSKSIVTPRPPERIEREYSFERDIERFVMVPANARKRHVMLEERLAQLEELTETIDLNGVVGTPEGAPLGIVAAGVAYEYVREVAPEVPVFKVGMSWPLPLESIARFAEQVEDLLVVEELSDFTLECLKAAAIPARGKDRSFRLGELNPDRVRSIIAGGPDVKPEPPDDAPAPRPPVLCPGCGHRSVFHVLKKLKLLVTGDIGCYTLGALPPLSNLDTCVCMGASIGNALGIERVVSEERARGVVAVIGDSTFFHSGLTGVLDAVYNGSAGTLLILDNSTTAMTGGQAHPGTGKRLDGEDAPLIKAADACRGLGVKDVREIDAYDRMGLEEALRDSLGRDEFTVIVCQRPCLLLTRRRPERRYRVEQERCEDCGACLRTGCPALRQAEGHVEIDQLYCAGCGLCYEVCRFDAIQQVDSPRE
ncbi:MAG: indolepyruvate ferredoxin oxidoreductase subunit alpha [Candidatus Brocadiaceae bacterium]|jgi:indolepyruvate ferredoxin oxidoreductase alpha subunit